MANPLATPPKHILVVDANDDVREVLADLLRSLNYNVSFAAGGHGMRAILDGAEPVDLVVLDTEMPGEPADELAQLAAERGIRLVMISGSLEAQVDFHARAAQLLHKPFGRSDLRRAVEVALESAISGQRKEDVG